jgi:hypothetical protein
MLQEMENEQMTESLVDGRDGKARSETSTFGRSYSPLSTGLVDGVSEIFH